MAAIQTRSTERHRINKRKIGERYETLALNVLCRAGLNFIARNVTFSCGEIDLIMKEEQTIVFVEVRYRRSANYGSAAVTVTPHKQRRLLNAATCWLAENNSSLDTIDCRFDIFAITQQQTEWLQNAFSNDLLSLQ